MSFTSGQILTASQLNTFDPSTKITNANGSNSAPSYTFNGDEDTGMFRGSSANTVAFATGGTQVVTISSDGRLGVGDTSPSATLHVNAATANTTAVFESTDAEAYIGLKDNASSSDLHVAVAAIGNDLVLRAGNSNAVRIKDDGDVGIGTTTPNAPLEVFHSTTDTVARFGSGDSGGFISFYDNDSANDFHQRIGADQDALLLQTAATNRIVIASDGDVGINTSTPSARLHIDSGAVNLGLLVESTDAGAIIGLKDNSTSGTSHVGIRATGDNLLLRAGNSNHVEVESGGDVNIETGNIKFEGSGKTVTAANPTTGTGNDAEWAAPLGIYILQRNSSLAAEKENVTADLGTHLTADMIDQVVPKMWNRIHAPGYPEIGPIAEDMDAISPFLAARGTTAENEPFLTGINKTAYLSLLVLAVKDLRTRVAALESA